MNKIIRFNDVELRSEMEAPRISGVPIVFNQRTDMGWYDEMISSEALNECDLSDVILNFNHDDSIVLARTTNQSLVLEINNDNVFMTGDIIDTTSGNDILKLVRNGLINKMSFAFVIANGGDEWKQEANGRELRVINKIEKLYDVSLVTFPAYSQTSAFVRSYGEDELAKEHKALMERKALQDKRMEELLNGKNLI